MHLGQSIVSALRIGQAGVPFTCVVPIEVSGGWGCGGIKTVERNEAERSESECSGTGLILPRIFSPAGGLRAAARDPGCDGSAQLPLAFRSLAALADSRKR
jgi:hypothetical protein